MFFMSKKTALIKSAFALGVFVLSFGAQALEQKGEQRGQMDQNCQYGLCEPDYCEGPSSTYTRLPGQEVTEVEACLYELVTKTFIRKIEVTNQWTDGVRRKQLMAEPIKRKFMVDDQWIAEKSEEKDVYTEVMDSVVEEDIHDVQINSETVCTHEGRVFKNIKVIARYKVDTRAKQRVTKAISAQQCDQGLRDQVCDDVQLQSGCDEIEKLSLHSHQDAKSASCPGLVAPAAKAKQKNAHK